MLGERESLERVRALGFDGVLIDVDRDLEALLAAASPAFEPAATTPDTPALLVYTSGTTGPPKGALHGHRVLAGHLPGFELSHDFYPQPGDRIWTPADWAWIGGLYDVLMPGLAHGTPVVAFRAPRFDPEQAFDVIARTGIRNVFMPATALRMMRRADGPPASLRTLASGGETVGEETAAWCRERFGVRLNEFYGQTEANLLIGNCAAWPERPGWMGRAYPGHELRLVDGEIAVRVDGDPVVFLGYWRDEQATAAKVRDGWLYTGDLAEVDDEGTYRSVGRVDDLISSGGYRIGPGEIEECLIRHPAVSIAAAIGTPDEVRGEVVKAFVVTVPGTLRLTRPRGRAPGARAHAPRALRGATRDRVRGRAAVDGDRQDPPRRAAAPRRGAPPRRLSATAGSAPSRARSPAPGPPARTPSRRGTQGRRCRACAPGRAGCRQGARGSNVSTIEPACRGARWTLTSG